MVSLVVASTSQTPDYNKHIVREFERIQKLTSHELELVLEINDDVTLGINYNNAVGKAKGEVIILLHNDVALANDFVDKVVRDIKKGRITTYTRVEPPIYKDPAIGKKLLDCGNDISNFDRQKFDEYSIPDKLQKGGNLMFFGCYKEDYIGLDGDFFEKFCEDSDMHMRYAILGFEKMVSPAMVYHFVSKTSRLGNYAEIERKSQADFIRKWGFSHGYWNKPMKKYTKGLFLNVSKYPFLIQNIFNWEPFFDVIFIHGATQKTRKKIENIRLKSEQYSRFDLSDKFIFLDGTPSANIDVINYFNLNVVLGITKPIGNEFMRKIHFYVERVIEGEEDSDKHFTTSFPSQKNNGIHTIVLDENSREEDYLWI